MTVPKASSATSAGSAYAVSTSASPGQASNAAATLLPAPPALGQGDPLAMLMLLQGEGQTQTTRAAGSEIQQNQNAKNQALKAFLDAVQKEKEAESHHSFWDDLGDLFGDIAKCAAVVAAAASVVATAGTAAPLGVLVVGCVAVSASTLDSNFHILQSLGVDPEAAGWIDFGLGIAGAAVTLGANLAQSSQSADALAQRSQNAASLVDGSATGVNGLATGAQGAAHIGAADAQQDSDNAEADQTGAIDLRKRLQRLGEAALEQLREWDEQGGLLQGLLAQAHDNLLQANDDLAANIGGARA